VLRRSRSKKCRRRNQVAQLGVPVAARVEVRLLHQVMSSYVWRLAGSDLGARGRGSESRHPDEVRARCGSLLQDRVSVGIQTPSQATSGAKEQVSVHRSGSGQPAIHAIARINLGSA
jgi:hypothetical protein